MTRWFVGCVDQGTTSSRVIWYDHALVPVVTHQLRHRQITPNPGWLQHDPLEILDNVKKCLAESYKKLQEQTGLARPDCRGLGVTNQRETTVVWDRRTGQPLHDAVVWCDLRSADTVDAFKKQHGEAFQRRTGLPTSPYFSAFKIKWLVDNVKEVREGLAAGTALVGTIDTWLVWNLTRGAKHVVSVCNASRMYLADIKKLAWDDELCGLFGVPKAALPDIVANTDSEAMGVMAFVDADHVQHPHLKCLAGVPVAGMIGDQQSAMVGQRCYSVGDAKNTYGTGCFMLMNIGNTPKFSSNGLLTTVCYHVKGEAPVYALEGAVVQAGMLITWLVDNMGIFNTPAEAGTLAGKVESSGGVAIVPAFAGLFAPHWRPDARGVICGVTMHTKKEHIARAAINAIAMQVYDVLKAMEADSALQLRRLKADGGMCVNTALMQAQADLAKVKVSVPDNKESTALGGAVCAALGLNLFHSLEDVSEVMEKHAEPTTFDPSMGAALRDDVIEQWGKAIKRSHDWVPAKL